MGAEELAVVAEEEDHRVLGQSGIVQVGEETSQVVVQILDLGVVGDLGRGGPWLVQRDPGG